MIEQATDSDATPFECVIGLEVHVQLATPRKAFCACPRTFGAPPNSQVCPVCLGLPGALPVLDHRAVDQALRLCLALGADVQRESAFDRKSYFYPDLPKGYQITQLHRPLALGGALPLTHHARPIPLLRLHLEEDAGKLIHPTTDGGDSRVDFNRAGIPLLEVVSAPAIRSPAEAQDYLRSMQQTLRFTGTSDGNMEQGSLRCDANISLRPRGSNRLGTRIEIKNLNSARHLMWALQYEVSRQAKKLRQGRAILPQTMAFDAKMGQTYPLRRKEDAQDYRYHPEPDLPLLHIDSERLARQSPEPGNLPWQCRQQLVKEGRSEEEARNLTASPALLHYYREAHRLRPELAGMLSNWIRTEVRRGLKEQKLEAPGEALPATRLVALLDALKRGTISSAGAKVILGKMWHDPSSPDELARRMGLVQVGDEARLQQWIEETLAAHPLQVRAFRDGKRALLGFFIGRVMAASEGRADPRRVEFLLRRRLDAPVDASPSLEKES